MKKTLLFGGLLASALYANAQQRLVLYEEFSGENCAPCAATNPGLMDTLTNNPNASKILLIKYQSPIPSAGPLYYQDSSDVNNRISYYNVPFAPYGRMDGAVSPGAPAGSQSAGHPGYLTKAAIAAETAIASPFNITVNNTVNGTTINSTINVSAVAGYTGGTVKLRAALVESLHFTIPPGTNGETDFHNVVREMYPSANGQSIPNTWAAGQNGTYTITGQIPSYVDRTHNIFLVVWIQDDANMAVAQAAKSSALPLPNLDGAITGATPLSGSMLCSGGTQPHKVTIKNTGTGNMTSAAIYYKVNNGAYQMYNWSGTLATGASQEVTVGNITLANGAMTVTDSIGTVNGAAEINPANSTYSSTLTVYTAPVAMPVQTSFEGGLPAGWAIWNNNMVDYSNNFGEGGWLAISEDGVQAYDGSWMAVAVNPYSSPGHTSIISMPLATIAAGPKALDFYYAYAMRGTTGDELDVVYSTDCGTTWTPLWTKSNAALANNPATPSNQLFVPNATSQYHFASVDVSAISANALVGFRAISGGGNYLFLDKVNFRTGAVTGINELVSGGNATLYPNPVADQVNVELNMVKAAKVTFQIVNMLGQQVGQSEVKDLNAGQTKSTINTNDLAPGMYFMNIITDKGNLQQKFVKK